ncbi:MAG: hypothetical protein WBA22_02760 [Candidatus Methanofastidiosia archaeon]
MIFQWIVEPSKENSVCPDVFCLINAGCPHLDEICNPYICVIVFNSER